MKELWKEIKDYPDYKISDLGRIRKTKIRLNGRCIKYDRKCYFVKDLMVKYFYDKPETVGQVYIIDNDKPLTLDNLRIETKEEGHNKRSEICKIACARGKAKYGRWGSFKAIPDEIRAKIRKGIENAKHQLSYIKEMASKYNVSTQTIYNIKWGK